MVRRSPPLPEPCMFLPEDRLGFHIVRQHSRNRGGPQFVHRPLEAYGAVVGYLAGVPLLVQQDCDVVLPPVWRHPTFPH
eukprot:3996896-Pyramimonas_sp.AAC.2